MFERPNLKENKIESFTFSTNLEIGTELNNLIKEKGKPLGKSYLFAETYTIARVKHTFTILFDLSRKFPIESQKTILEAEMTFRFRLSPGAKASTRLSIANEIIAALNDTETIRSYRCSIEYDYKNRYKRKFILALPIIFAESPVLPFRTIDGFTMTGKTESIDYSAFIEYSSILKTTHLLIIFQKGYHFSNNISEQIINDANNIIDKLMLISGGK